MTHELPGGRACTLAGKSSTADVAPDMLLLDGAWLPHIASCWPAACIQPLLLYSSLLPTMMIRARSLPYTACAGADHTLHAWHPATYMSAAWE